MWQATTLDTDMRFFVWTLLICAILASCARRDGREPVYIKVPPALGESTVSVTNINVSLAVAPTNTVTALTTNFTVYIGGEVKEPGQQAWTNGLTLKGAIELAGGFADYADRSRVDVRRKTGAQKRYNYGEVIGARTNSPALAPGDVVYVNRRFLW